MAAFFTHVVVGILLGLAMRVRLRYVLVVGVAASFMDLDNVFFYLGKPDPWWLTRRGTFQNLWFGVVFPAVGAAAVFLWGRWGPDLERLAAAMPVATASHMLLDMIATRPPYVVDLGHMLLFPFSKTRWGFDVSSLMADERLFDAFTLVLLVTLPLMAASLLLTTGIGKDETPARRWARVGLFLVAYLVVLPSVVFGMGVGTG